MSANSHSNTSQIADLKDECTKRSLATDGKKADLVQRLQDHEAGAGKKAKTDVAAAPAAAPAAKGKGKGKKAEPAPVAAAAEPEVCSL